MAMVCLCHGVNERRVCHEIERGARSCDDIAAACHAGSSCQGCHATLDRLLAERGATATTPVALTPV